MEVSKKLLYGADSVEPNSVYFSINKPYNIVALNLDNCTAVRFEQAITELAPMPTSTECLCVYNISKPDILGFIPLKCESCNEEDGYVQITADNPSIILEFPQNTPLRAYFVNRYTGERLDKPEDLVLLKTQKVSIMATLNVSAEPRTPSAIGCAPFCPPTADWVIDCETLGWREIPNCYPADWFEEIKSCEGVSSITAKCDGTFETTTTPSEHLGYLLKESKWWACNAVYDCYGDLIGYGMANQCNDCPPCSPDKVESIIEECEDSTPNTCDYEGEVWNNDKLGDNMVFQIYSPEGDTNPIYSPLKVSTADEMIEVLNITQKYMYFFMDKLQNDPNAPDYQFAKYKEIQTYMDSLGNPYYLELKEWCEAHNIRSKFNTDEAYEKAITDFIADTRGILLRPKYRSLVKLTQDEVIPKVEVVKVSPDQEVTATFNYYLNGELRESPITLTQAIGSFIPPQVDSSDSRFKFGALSYYEYSSDSGTPNPPDLTFNIVNNVEYGSYGEIYYYEYTEGICVLRFVVMEY